MRGLGQSWVSANLGFLGQWEVILFWGALCHITSTWHCTETRVKSRQVNRGQLKDVIMSISWLKRLKCGHLPAAWFAHSKHGDGTVLNVENLNLALRCRRMEAFTAPHVTGFGSTLFFNSFFLWYSSSVCTYIYFFFTMPYFKCSLPTSKCDFF